MNITEVHDLKWNFDGDEPYFEYGGYSGYPMRATVDPFPCYAHNIDIVRLYSDNAEYLCPLPKTINIFISHYELIQRCNAFAIDFEESGAIVLSGKRQPIMPQMTRYIVSHEYGHHVEHAVDALLYDSRDKVWEDYLELRPKANREYGARQWHSNISELYAEDFRVLVLKSEVEYWPHPGFKHPTECNDIILYWEDTMKLLKESKT